MRGVCPPTFPNMRTSEMVVGVDEESWPAATLQPRLTNRPIDSRGSAERFAMECQRSPLVKVTDAFRERTAGRIWLIFRN